MPSNPKSTLFERVAGDIGRAPSVIEPKTPGRFGQVRADSFINSLTGLGDPNRDKREQGSPLVHTELSQADFENLYQGSDLGGSLCEALPDEMMREGFRIHVEGDPEQSEEINDYIEGLNVIPRIKEALVWGRQHGGSGVLMGADDGEEDLSIPLDLDSIKTIRFFNTFTRWELYPMYYYGDPIAPKYGHPSIFYLQQLFGLPQELADPSGQSGGFQPISSSIVAPNINYPDVGMKATPGGYAGRTVDPISGKRVSLISSAQPLRTVHESRFMLFDGIPVTRRVRVQNNGWGDSVFLRVFEVLRDFEMSWAGVCHLLTDYAQGVYKLEGLNDLMLAGNDGDVIARALLIDMTRSAARGIVLDAGHGPDRPAESFERVATPVDGLSDLMDKLALRLAAAARMPVSLLLGQAPAGLNATGDSDIRWYYDRIKSKQNELLLPALKQLMKVIFATKDGPTNGKEPENWSIVFNNLWQLGNLEEANRRNFIAQSDIAYIGAGVVTAEEVMKTRFGNDTYDGDGIKVDADAREKFNVTSEEELKVLAAKLQMGQGNLPDGSPMPTDPQTGLPATMAPGTPPPKPGDAPGGDGKDPKKSKSKGKQAAADTSPADEKPGKKKSRVKASV